MHRPSTDGAGTGEHSSSLRGRWAHRARGLKLVPAFLRDQPPDFPAQLVPDPANLFQSLPLCVRYGPFDSAFAIHPLAEPTTGEGNKEVRALGQLMRQQLMACVDVESDLIHRL